MHRLITAVLLLVASLGIRADDWDARHVPDTTPDAIVPTGISRGSDSGLWVIGELHETTPALSSVGSGAALVHYAADGARDFAVPAPHARVLEPLPDGGVVTIDDTSYGCRLRDLDRTGTLRWQTFPATNAVCRLLAVDGAGGVWLLRSANDSDPYTVERFRPDGVRTFAKTVGELGLAGVVRIEPYSDSGNAVLVGSVLSATDPQHYVGALLSLHADGSVAWRTALADGGLFRAVVDSQGRVFAIGGYMDANDDPHVLTTLVGSDGTPLRVDRFPDYESIDDSSLGLMFSGDSDLYAAAVQFVALSGHYERRLLHFDANGALTWTDAIGYDDCGPSSDGSGDVGCALTPISAGGVAIASAVPSADGTRTLSLSRYSSDGHKLVAPFDADTFPFAVSYVAATDLVIVATKGPAPSSPSSYRLDRYDAAAVRRDSLALGGLALTHESLGKTASDPVGALYRASNVASAIRLEKLGDDHRIVWARSIADPSASVDGLVAGDRQVCVELKGAPGGSSSVRCFATADGAPLADPLLAIPAPGSLSIADIDGDRVRLVEHGSDFYLVLDFLHGSNTVVYRTTLGQPLYAARDNGRFAIVGPTIMFFEADGRLTATSSPYLHEPMLAQPLADGSLLVIGRNGQTTSVDRVDSQGNLTRAPQLLAADAQRDASVAIAGNTAIVALAPRTAGTFPHAGTVRLLALTLDDLRVRWSRDLPGFEDEPASLFANPAGDRVLLVRQRNGFGASVRTDAVLMTLIDPRDGTTLRESHRACADESCRIADSRLAATGRLDVAAGDRIVGLFGENEPFAVAAPGVTVASASIDGPWYAPESSGQGLVFDYLGDSRTVFLTWFTYDTDPALTPAGLRWYTLQRDVAAGATSADLTIYRNTGGRFAQAPAVAPQPVGHARLVMPSCDTASLSYAFDGGPSGTLALERLLPGAIPCGSSNASLQQTVSGTWYDPATAGQGLSFVARPNENFFFAAWFTYDPAGAADDTTSQHWLTIQGSLAPKPDGSLVLPIYRTIGGSLDLDSTADTMRVGTATLRFADCTHASLDYRFDTTEVAGAFSGRADRMMLERIGACPP